MDATDVRIFCEMAFKYTGYRTFAERKISPTEVGKNLGLDEKTVRLRVKKMEDEGFIKYYQALPNLSLLGIQSISLYSFEAADIPSKHEAIDYFRNSPYIIEIVDTLGPIFTAVLAGFNSEEIQKTVNEITGKLKLRQWKISDRNVATTTLTPTNLDWQIMRHLRYDALCPIKNVAEALSITYKMVDHRISKLLEYRGLFIRAIIDVQQQRGIIFYILSLVVDEAKQSRIMMDLQETYREKLWFFTTLRGGFLFVNLFAFTSGEPEKALMNTLKLEGVKRGSLFVTKEWIEPKRPNWIDGLIEDKIDAAE